MGKTLYAFVFVYSYVNLLLTLGFVTATIMAVVLGGAGFVIVRIWEKHTPHSRL